ncbi:phage tail protein [Alkaliphilus oremlandii]|uniref:SbsA Ig-like domain-containing protein n=1 Tax=Alkaliphilus oremlandii (strain OhILAs) TaxID=350688 RepID=A8MK25_ALKOO|nr:hypothetical protein [Alkaliphilus oremlandii]ABW20157.1 hypothetical protein Clos_2626 [Alkaliphilus oremlandii OhILAs]
MKNYKRISSVVLATVMLASTSIASAAPRDVYTTDGNIHKTAQQMALSAKEQRNVAVRPSSYLFEGNGGKLYSFKDANEAYLKNKNDFLNILEKDYTPVKDVETPVEGELKVVEVSAINAKKIKVTFGQEVVRSGQAENTANYTIKKKDGSPVTVSTATLSSNEKEATLILGAALDGDYIVMVDPIQSKADATKTTALYTKEISFKDTVKPTVASVTYPLAGQAVIQMSEEVDMTGATATIVRVDGTAITTETVNIDPNDASKFAVKGIAANKEYKVTLLGVKDLAGNIISPNPAEVTVKSIVVDEVAPEIVSVKSEGLQKVIVTFSEEVDESTITLSLDGTPDSSIIAAKNPKNPLEVEITLGAVTTAGAHAVELTAFDDLVGNSGTAKSFNVQFKAQAAKLEKTTVAADNKSVALTFDMNVDKTATDISLTRVDADMVTTTVSVLNADITADGTTKDFVLNNASGFAPGKYTGQLTVADVTPLGATDKIAIAFEIKAPVDTEKATVTLGAIDAKNVVVNFDKEMGASALDVNNYKVEGKTVFKSAIFDGNAKTVKLTLNTETILLDGDYEFTIDSAVKTKAGVAIDAFAEVATFEENVAPTVKKIEFTAPNKVTITFSENVTANANFATVKVDGVADATKFGVVTTSNTATVTLTTSVTDLTKPITVEFDKTIDVTDANGNKLVPEASYTVAK